MATERRTDGTPGRDQRGRSRGQGFCRLASRIAALWFWPLGSCLILFCVLIKQPVDGPHGTSTPKGLCCHPGWARPPAAGEAVPSLSVTVLPVRFASLHDPETLGSTDTIQFLSPRGPDAGPCSPTENL